MAAGESSQPIAYLNRPQPILHVTSNLREAVLVPMLFFMGRIAAAAAGLSSFLPQKIA